MHSVKLADETEYRCAEDDTILRAARFEIGRAS
jgi:hypothetical protein